jgi:hypothetical protein
VDAALREQRLAELGAVPPAMAAVREAVGRGDYGAALRAAEAAAGAAGAPEEVRAAARKVLALAEKRLQARLERAAAVAAAGRAEEARVEYERAAADFAGTALEAKAKERPAPRASPGSGWLSPRGRGAILPPWSSAGRAAGRLA